MSAVARSTGSEFLRSPVLPESSITSWSSMIRSRHSRAFKPATLTWRSYDFNFFLGDPLCPAWLKRKNAFTLEDAREHRGTWNLHAANHPFPENLRCLHHRLRRGRRHGRESSHRGRTQRSHAGSGRPAESDNRL